MGLGQRIRTAALRPARRAVGIDIGAGALKVVQISWRSDRPRLEHCVVAPVPAGAVAEGSIVKPRDVGLALKAAVGQIGVTQRFVGTCVGGPAVLMRYLSLPRMPAEEMRAALKFEAPQHLPIVEDDLVYDFTPVPEVDGTSEGQVEVFLAGTHKRLVAGCISALGEAGMRPTAIELDCLAALRALYYAKLAVPASRLPLVLLDIGEMDARISIIRFGVPMLSRTIPTGLYHARAAVVQALAIPLEEAEALLRDQGVGRNPALRQALQSWIAELMESVGRSIEFFLIQNRGAVLEQVFLMGGGAMLPGLSETLMGYLQTALAGRPEARRLVIQPVSLSGLAVSKQCQADAAALGPLLVTALGSALRGEG